MAPQTSNKAATASTTNLLFRAKSTRARIISCSCFPFRYAVLVSQSKAPGCSSMSQHVVQDQRIGDYLLSRRKSRLNVLQVCVIRQQIAADYLHAAKLLIWRGHEDKIAIMHVQDGGCRNDRVHLSGLTAKGRLREHAQPHDSGIVNFYSDLRRPNAWIEDRANIANRSLERSIGIRI